jgi:beta-hydroxylase
MNITANPRTWLIKGGKRLLRGIGRFQGSRSLVGTGPFLDAAEFPWVPEFESRCEAIGEELAAVLKRPEDIPAFHQLSPDQKRISKGENWKTFAFYVFGIRLAENCARCPETARAIEALPGLQNAWFSILAPHYHIPPHRGPTRAVVRCHLALVVPTQTERCWLLVLFVDVDRPSDLVGRWFNRLIVALVRSSAYVKDPLKNLAAWNKRKGSSEPPP